MEQPKEKPTVEQVLKLVEELTLEEQAEVREELDLQELRRNIKIGLEQSARGEVIDGDEVFRRLRERNAAMKAKGNP
ncbi:MAG: hypothetical protein AB1457_17240 [Chloroflexota bacterium]|jgi:predicted transcriptional regulator